MELQDIANEKIELFKQISTSKLADYNIYIGKFKILKSIQLPKELSNLYGKVLCIDIRFEYCNYSENIFLFLYVFNEIKSGRAVFKNKSFSYINKFCKKNNLYGFTRSINGCGVLAQFKNKEDEVKLYLRLPDSKLYRLNISVEKYAELFMKTGGLPYWELYILDEFPEVLKDRDYDGFFENMELLFPEEDLSEFKHRELFEGKKDLLREMGGNSYKHQFDAVFEHLPDTISVYKKEYGDRTWRPTSLTRIRKLELMLDIHLPKAFKQFYMCLGGLELRWLTNDKSPVKTSGISDFRYIDETFDFRDFHKATIYEKLQLDNSKYPQLAGIYLLYLQEREMLGFKLINGEMKFYVIIYSTSIANYSVHSLDMDFDSILQAFLECRGLNHWLAALLHDVNYYDVFMENLAALFPDADSSIFEK